MVVCDVLVINPRNVFYFCIDPVCGVRGVGSKEIKIPAISSGRKVCAVLLAGPCLFRILTVGNVIGVDGDRCHRDAVAGADGVGVGVICFAVFIGVLISFTVAVILCVGFLVAAVR